MDPLFRPPSCIVFDEEEASKSPKDKKGASLGDELRRRLSAIEGKLADIVDKLDVKSESDSEPISRRPISPSNGKLSERLESKGSLEGLEPIQLGTTAKVPITAVEEMENEEEMEDPDVAKKKQQVAGWTQVSRSREKTVSERVRKSIAGLQTVEYIVNWRINMLANFEKAQATRLQRIIRSMAFESMSCLIILAHAIFMGRSASIEYIALLNGQPPTEWVNDIEMCFGLFFTVELVIRLIAFRVMFFVGPSWGWNWLDFFLVMFGFVDILINGSEAGAFLAVTVGRLLRLLRFVRLWRITRVMKHFSTLRIVLFAILHSVMQLFWCWVLMTFIMYMFSILFLYGCAEYFRHNPQEQDDPVAIMLGQHYGRGVNDVLHVLFASITGGMDWVEALDQWWSVAPLYGYLFYFYIYFMYFGVINVVMATFLSSTMDIANKDREQFIKNEIGKMEEYMRNVRQFFKEADVDGSGSLSWEEFETHISNPRVRAYFQALDLDVSQAHLLFEMLDVDGGNSVSIDEFIDGCVRLRGGARNVDLNMILLQSQKLTKSVYVMHKKNRVLMHLVEDVVKSLRGERGASKPGMRKSVTVASRASPPL